MGYLDLDVRVRQNFSTTLFYTDLEVSVLLNFSTTYFYIDLEVSVREDCVPHLQKTFLDLEVSANSCPKMLPRP